MSFWQQENSEISQHHFGCKKTGRLASVILAARKQGDKLVSFWQQENSEISQHHFGSKKTGRSQCHFGSKKTGRSQCHFGSKKTGRLASVILAARK